MKNNWQKDIHDRMTDLEATEPQGLWDDICAAEGAHAAVPVTGQHKPAFIRWMGGAAAAACLLLGWYLYPSHEPEVTGSPEPPIAASHHQPPTSGPSSPQPLGPQAVATAIARHSPAPIAQPDQHPGQECIAQQPPAQQPSAQPDQDHPAVPSVPFSQTLAEIPSPRSRIPAPSRTPPQSPRLTLALSSSGGMASTSRSAYHAGYASATATAADAEWKDSPLLGIMYLNRGVETQKEVRHHAPIRTGLSLTYVLNDRWSLESGVTYALVTSDLHEGSMANFIDEEQKLHYIGVPLGLSYRAFTWRSLDLYLSTDVLAEQCVSGQTTRHYTLGDQTRQQEAIPVPSHPLQVSVGAKVGVQYRLNSLLSVYAEPGCRYYIDDQSSLQTVFKEKPLDLVLNLGVRFMLGNE